MNTKINNLTPCFESKYLSTYLLEYTDKTGNNGKWYTVSRRDEDSYRKNLKKDDKMIDAVLMAVYHLDLKKMVIIKQFRLPLNAYLYEIPAGLIDEGESPKETLVRELKEETGLDLVDIISSKERVFSSCGLTDEAFNMYFITAKGEMSQKFLTDNEEIEVIAIDQKDAKDILNSDEKLDMKALYAIELFSLLGEKLFEK